ncbi:unnamed protein product [Didymodactylos carnosus]|uniref:T-complex protein 1 subunit theta n=1 Tax=Didymodactylos carnosus TaxID=1234261 RepID=A0A813XBX0_9BILA|nr:unnamed protein product [Didymodactylos carnosus]CAF0867727.1 unnamed protein product [Didymodactylos carnosus]CAF3514395.1 unnamed protein product [Didymodactylos carnosus]CAF3655188.1 unnamed protein product [Didymodactylos carnosus]
MAMHVPKAPGFASMMKEGARYSQGLDGAVYRNINACKELCETTSSSFGPNGLNKMVINHIEKLFVTNDAASILREIDVVHPAAKILTLASEMQEKEVGDGTNYVILFGSKLLENAENLLRMGLSQSEIIDGYLLALEKTLEILPKLELDVGVKLTKDNLNEHSQLITKVLQTSIGSKLFGYHEFLGDLVAQACLTVSRAFDDGVHSFNVDNVRICKILGGGLLQSTMVSGMVLKREVDSEITKVQQAKIAVFSCPIDIQVTETKGTVLLKSADELLSFSKDEETGIESTIKAIHDCGINVIVSSGKIGEMALHFLNKYEIMAVRLMSKFDLRRVAKTIGAVVLPKLRPATHEEMGYCDSIYLDEIGDTSVIVFKHKKSSISTIILRGSTEQVLDDCERALDDAINNFKALTKEQILLPGGGATEIELAQQLTAYAQKCPGIEQYAIKRFAETFECIPKILAENSGCKSTEILAKLYVGHQDNHNLGFLIARNQSTKREEQTTDIICDASDMKLNELYDLYITKKWAVMYGTKAACTVLSVDEIICAKPAGGPKPKENKGWDNDD